MSGAAVMTIEADSSADLLCRLVGLFAQRDLPPPGMVVNIVGAQMTITVDLSAIGAPVAPLLAEKIAKCIGVAAVTIDGTPLAYMPPTSFVPA